MWWEQEWHVWLGLSLSAFGILVSGGAWLYAALARSKAKDVETALDAFKKDLDQRLERDAVQRSTAPVTNEPANFVYRTNGREYWLVNEGPGCAYEVRLSEVAGIVKLASTTKWAKFEVEQSERLVLINEAPYDYDAVLDIRWIEYADGPTEDQQIAVNVPGVGLGYNLL